uniref:Uncharacterized protein n=1 Tax=Gloeothece verrucosa (strain PCC 7822) TaxID=497965 RepID=E0UJ75_GLOV7|nr:hypothetical protein Cyan7822_3846 [Gloeothece verrucosa PCC 7822]
MACNCGNGCNCAKCQGSKITVNGTELLISGEEGLDYIAVNPKTGIKGTVYRSQIISSEKRKDTLLS